MKKAARLFVVSIICALSIAPGIANAATPTTITVGPTPPPSSAPDLIITTIVGSSLPDFLELYNQSSSPLDLRDWRVEFAVHDTSLAGCGNVDSSVALPASWLLSKRYVTLERTSTPAPGSVTLPFNIDISTLLAGCVAPQLGSVSLVHGTEVPEQLVTIPTASWSATIVTVAQHKQRSNSPSSTRAITGDFASDYKIAAGAITLNSDPLYVPPSDTASLQILEILPNARECSPLDTDPTCGDYIKLFNPTDQPINLANYRIRVGYKGQSESVTNTFTWGAELDPSHDELVLPAGQYFMLTARNDGQPISITDTGNYIWLEDAYGTTVYEPLVAYPDASSTTKVGYAWAYDGSAWKWTSAPQPSAPNYFPPIPVTAEPTGTSSETSVSILKPCAIGQYRNPATNRCKSTVTASSAILTPCGTGQERNLETNRCRSIVTASSSLTPCQPGWERNPATNRCRKSASAVAGAATSAEDVAAPTVDSPTGWYVAAVAVAAAGAYAIYEWRQDLRLVFERTQYMVMSHLPTKLVRRKRHE